MKLTESNSVNLAKPLAESAVAPGECGSVPDERTKFEAWSGNRLSGNDKFFAWEAWFARASLGMQPPNNQPNLICKSCGVDRSKEDCKGDRLRCGLAGIAHSDYVAVTSAKTDFVHLAAPIETSTDTSLKTWPERIWLQHGDSPDIPEFSEVADAVTWCIDQIESSDVEYVRADLQSGIGSVVGRPNEQNDVVQEEKQ